jgi:long-chain acyl-CoA synthetase
MEALDRGVVPTVLEKFSPRQVVDRCLTLGLEMIYATPAHLNLMIAYGRKKRVPPLTTVSHILAGGAKLDERHLSQLETLFPHAQIVEFFGTTETSYITMKSPDSPAGSVGKALAGVSLRITDTQGQTLPPGREGMLWINSDMLFEDYVFGEDPNTRWRGGFVTVGDQGYLDPDGNLFFTARIGSMVTIAGENVFLDHLERRLHARVQAGESAILPIEDPLRGRRLVAVTQFEMPRGQAGAILRSLRDEFGPLKSPKSLIHMKDWPFLPSGKTDRQTLLTRVAGKA